jgi:glucose/arabinose dehydrogenase
VAAAATVGGQIDFDGRGNQFLSTGDDTNPFFSDGYAPLDDRPGRNPAFDARRSAANTNDLRGKLLRIRVKAGGGYTVPRGNLFPPGTPRTRPEIYAMGLRNPSDSRSTAPTATSTWPTTHQTPRANPLRGPPVTAGGTPNSPRSTSSAATTHR